MLLSQTFMVSVLAFKYLAHLEIIPLLQLKHASIFTISIKFSGYPNIIY